MKLTHAPAWAWVIFHTPTTALAWTPENNANCAKPAGMSSYFSRCVARPSTSQPVSVDNAYCLPGGSTGGTALPSSFTVEKKTGNSYATLSIGVKNCRQAANTVSGDFVIAIDNSSSACNLSNSGTDCAKRRLTFAKTVATALTSGTNNVGIVAYGGRQTTVFSPPTYTNDAANKIDPDSTKVECLNYASRAGADPWEISANGSYNSVCEYKSLATSTDLTNTQNFIDATGAIPRGSTDYTYIFEAIKKNDLLGGSTHAAKHAILITDGLPSVPKRIPRAICEISNILMSSISAAGGKFFTEDSAPNREYCYDKQYREAIDHANKYVDGLVDFSGSSATLVAPRFSGINLHNVLYVSSGLAYSDTDYTTKEQLFPDDVLMENSARTGNGKVKFTYIHGSNTDISSAEQSFLTKLKEAADTNAVQRVEVVLGGVTYQAVSSGAFDETFDIKIPGLTTTTNATIKVYYANSGTTPSEQNITITVNSASTHSSGACSDVSSDLTIDGDSLTTLTPDGDGFLPYLKSTGDACRIYRNKSDYSRNLSDFYIQKYGETQREKAARLRIQGGTGNCGNLTGASAATAHMGSIMALIPSLLIILTRKRRKK